jgi:tRNA (mo5U34)-methyltransferase
MKNPPGFFRAKAATGMSDTLERKMNSPKTPVEEKISTFGTWFHNLHLPDGTQTAPDHPLGDFPRFKWKQIEPFIPKNLNGWKVLDIGCNAGFYSFELAKRGAEVLGIDVDERYLRQAEWAAGQFSLRNKVQFKIMHVYELANLAEKFDIILFLGIFYHLRYPLLALDIISNLFKKLLIFQTLTMPGDDVVEPAEDIGIFDRDIMLEPGFPKMAFIEKKLAGDYTNWWAPNHAAVEAMLRSCGMKVTARPAHEIYLCEFDFDNFNNNEMNAALNALNNHKGSND